MINSINKISFRIQINCTNKKVQENLEIKLNKRFRKEVSNSKIILIQIVILVSMKTISLLIIRITITNLKIKLIIHNLINLKNLIKKKYTNQIILNNTKLMKNNLKIRVSKKLQLVYKLIINKKTQIKILKTKMKPKFKNIMSNRIILNLMINTTHFFRFKIQTITNK